MMISYWDQYNFIYVRQQLCFPSKELIIFDSGKLTSLINLLLRLKENKQKALIFTQMSKMLDILEVALNYKNIKYLRLDGSTRAEMR
jgi:helicase SWR1